MNLEIAYSISPLAHVLVSIYLLLSLCRALWHILRAKMENLAS